MAGRKVSHSDEWWANPPGHILRCTANYRTTGDRCRREALPGTNVCGSHGGLIPAVQAAAATRLGMSVDDAVKRLHAMLDDSAVEARDKVKILQDLLDRGGLGATSKHLVGVAAIDPVETLFRDILADPRGLANPTAAPPALPAPDPVQAALDAAEDVPDWNTFRARQIGADDADDVVDAEVVEDLPDPPHTVRVEQSMSDRPPKWLEEDLRRLI